jgi:hypothetical protein
MFFGLNDVAFLAAVAGGAALDPDAAAYIAAVEAADTQALEPAVRTAINDFVVGCKADGIWAAIKASCILAGARTLTGALVPLVGAAPTNFNFASGDYNRKTGLVGNGSTKYLDSNRNNNADPQDSNHISVYVASATSSSASGANSFPRYIGANSSSAGSTEIARGASNGNLELFSRGSGPNTQFLNLASEGGATGFIGVSRVLSSSFSYRTQISNSPTVSLTSQTPASINYWVHRSSGASSGVTYSNGRISFYSIGESLDLALLDARVTALINAFDAAI